MRIMGNCCPQSTRNRSLTICSASNGFSLHFYGRPVHKPAYIVFHRHKNSTPSTCDTSPSLVGYVHYTSVSGDRRRQFEPCPGPVGTANSVGARICQKRLAKTTPEEWSGDPYFLCHLLALAQLQENTISPKPTVYTVSYFICSRFN